jgi:hypothetical protein
MRIEEERQQWERQCQEDMAKGTLAGSVPTTPPPLPCIVCQSVCVSIPCLATPPLAFPFFLSVLRIALSDWVCALCCCYCCWCCCCCCAGRNADDVEEVHPSQRSSAVKQVRHPPIAICVCVCVCVGGGGVWGCGGVGVCGYGCGCVVVWLCRYVGVWVCWCVGGSRELVFPPSRCAQHVSFPAVAPWPPCPTCLMLRSLPPSPVV